MWEVNTDNNQWILSPGLKGSGSAGVYDLSIKGADPYMHSHLNLNIDASVLGLIKIKMQNQTSDTNFQIFWITNSDVI